jgi:hypothetical protein
MVASETAVMLLSAVGMKKLANVVWPFAHSGSSRIRRSAGMTFFGFTH